MTDKQSEAQRLADLLVRATVDKDLFTTALGFDAANELSVLDYKAKEQTAELRRLHEANEAFGKRQEWWNERMFALEKQCEELLEALKMAWPLIETEKLKQDGSYGSNFVQAKADRIRAVYEKARAAIARAEEKK